MATGPPILAPKGYTILDRLWVLAARPRSTSPTGAVRDDEHQQ
jgi:hypothetical protein